MAIEKEEFEKETKRSYGMIAHDLIFCEGIRIEYKEKYNNYNIHCDKDNRALGQIYFKKDLDRWVIEFHSFAIFDIDNLNIILKEIERIAYETPF